MRIQDVCFKITEFKDLAWINLNAVVRREESSKVLTNFSSTLSSFNHFQALNKLKQCSAYAMVTNLMQCCQRIPAYLVARHPSSLPPNLQAIIPHYTCPLILRSLPPPFCTLATLPLPATMPRDKRTASLSVCLGHCICMLWKSGNKQTKLSGK